MLCDERDDAAHAKLCGFLHDEVELLAFGERLRQRQIEWRFDRVGERFNDFEPRRLRVNPRHAAAVFAATAVKGKRFVAVAQPQHARQMMALVARQVDARFADLVRRDVETAALHQALSRAATIADHSPAARRSIVRMPAAASAPSTSPASVVSIPERIIVPVATRQPTRSAISAMITSAVRLATTTSNAPPA